jgi:hypothetical protein
MEYLAQTILVEVVEVAGLKVDPLLEVVTEAQAAPVSLSSSTKYQAKRYLCSKALPLGNARQVLPALTILWLRVVGAEAGMLDRVAARVVIDMEQGNQ